MSWEWRRVKRSFGTKRRKEIFKTLRYYNSALQDCRLERREALLDTENRVVSQVRGRFSEINTINTRKNAQLLHKAMAISFDCKCKIPHEGCMQLQWYSNKPTSSKAFNMVLSTKVIASGQQDHLLWRALSFNIEQLPPEKENSNDDIRLEPMSLLNNRDSNAHASDGAVSSDPLQSPKKKKGVRFWDIQVTKERVEKRLSQQKSSLKNSFQRKTSTTHIADASSIATDANTTTTSTLALPQVSTPPLPAKLCSMLGDTSASHSIPRFIPLPDPDSSEQIRVDFMDEMSMSVLLRAKHPIDLQTLLSRQRDQITNQRLRLNRKRRFAVASALAWAVLHLCDSPWLDEILSADNIRFFLEQQNGSGAPELSNHPYLAHAFKLSESDPTAAGKRSSQNNAFYNKQVENITLYTLAIRLIELGRDKTLAQLRQEYHLITGEAIKADPDILDDFDVAKFHIRELELDPGIAYSHAVDRCLRFIFPGSADTNTFEHRPFRSMFFSDVVAPIQATYELIPGSLSQV